MGFGVCKIRNRKTLVYAAILMLQMTVWNTSAIAQNPDSIQNLFLERMLASGQLVPQDTIQQVYKIDGSNPFEVDHQLLPKAEKSVEVQEAPMENEKSILFIAMILSLALLAITIGDNKKTFGRLIRSLNNSNYQKLFYRDSRSNYPAMLIVLYIFAFISISIFIYLILGYYNVNFNLDSTTYLLVIILLILSAMILIKHLFLNFLSYVFPIDKEVKLYSFSMMLALIATGILIAPVNAIIAFGDESYIKLFIYIGISIIIFFYIFQQFRGILYGSRYLVYNTFHFFLYICTVEILPMALIAKVISNF